MTADEGTGYLIEFPDVPLCMSDGPTVEEAIANGRDALKCCLLTMKEFGDPIPKPGSAEAASGQFRLRVPKTMHARLTQSRRAGGGQPEYVRRRPHRRGPRKAPGPLGPVANVHSRATLSYTSRSPVFFP